MKVYFSNTKVNYRDLINLLPVERQEYILRFQKENDRNERTLASIILYYALKEHNITDPLMYSSHGKPYVAGIKFNISHSNSYVVCAIGNQEMGIDIEKITPKIMKLKLNGLSDMEALTREWTRREAFLKLIGEGIAGIMDVKIPEGVYLDSIKIDDYIISLATYAKNEIELVPIDIANISF